MFNFLASCGICSSQPTPGSYAYEAYHKIHQEPINKNQGVRPVVESYSGNLPTSSVIAGYHTFTDLTNEYPREVYIRKIMKSKYQQLLSKHAQTGQNFIDNEFPPDQSSVGNVEDLRVRATWKRIPDVVKDPVFIQGKIDPNSIFQGSLGDYYFLSAISALAQKDHRIKSLFPSLIMNKSGIYMARILHKGVLRQVIVDDYIPVNQQGEPLFAKPAANREIWIMILEKCWAKLNGSYGAIIGGLPNEVLHAFSAAPTQCIQIQNNRQKQEQLWLQIERDNQDGAIFCCSSKNDKNIETKGLMPGHAYTIGAISVGQTTQWKGRAGRGDFQFWSSIAPVDRQRMFFSEHDNSVFFMLWQDFLHFFDTLSTCKINDNASYSNVQCQFSGKNAEIFEFETQGGNITLDLNQYSSNKSFVRSVIIIAKYQEDAMKGFQYRYVTSSTTNKEEHTVDLEGLPKGKYVIYAKFLWPNKVENKGCISIYTDIPTHLIHSSQSQHKGFLYQTFLDHARTNHKKQSLGPGQWVCNDLLLKQCGYGYLAFHLNEDSNRKIGIQISQNEYTEKRIVLKKPYRSKGIIKATIHPGKELIILFHIKSQSLPYSVTLPTPKMFNLI